MLEISPDDIFELDNLVATMERSVRDFTDKYDHIIRKIKEKLPDEFIEAIEKPYWEDEIDFINTRNE